MGKLTVERSGDIKSIPIIMEYDDEGYTLENIDDFIEATKRFKIEAAERYKDQPVRIFFLPAEQVKMLIASQQ